MLKIKLEWQMNLLTLVKKMIDEMKYPLKKLKSNHILISLSLAASMTPSLEMLDPRGPGGVSKELRINLVVVPINFHSFNFQICNWFNPLDNVSFGYAFGGHRSSVEKVTRRQEDEI